MRVPSEAGGGLRDTRSASSGLPQIGQSLPSTLAAQLRGRPPQTGRCRLQGRFALAESAPRPLRCGRSVRSAAVSKTAAGGRRRPMARLDALPKSLDAPASLIAAAVSPSPIPRPARGGCGDSRQRSCSCGPGAASFAADQLPAARPAVPADQSSANCGGAGSPREPTPSAAPALLPGEPRNAAGLSSAGDIGQLRRRLRAPPTCRVRIGRISPISVLRLYRVRAAPASASVEAMSGAAHERQPSPACDALAAAAVAVRMPIDCRDQFFQRLGRGRFPAAAANGRNAEARSA